MEQGGTYTQMVSFQYKTSLSTAEERGVGYETWKKNMPFRSADCKLFANFE